MLRSTPHLKATRQQIADFFTAHDDITERTEFIKSIFNNDYTELLLDGDQRVGYKTYQNVLHVWEGSYTQRMSQAYYNWSVVAGHYASMLLLGEFLDNGPPGLPTEQQQIVMIEQAEVEKASAFAIPQEAIDAILQQGSGVQDGKYRIYLQFQKDASAKENTDFLRNEYGIGGHGPALTGTDIDEWHDGKGITLTRGSLIGENRKITLPWAKVQKRISELITADRYLNSKEKERLPVYEKQMVDHLQQLAEQAYAREVLNREPAPDLPEMPERENEKQILSIGSIVYVGADQYEVVSLDENTVELRDKNFPLLNKSYPRHAFKQVLNENQLNSHLILPVQAAEEDEPEVLPRKLYQLSDEGQVTREELIVGLELTIEDRRFAIDSISKENGTVSLRDVTFQNGTGFPIFRRESIAFVRDAIRQQKRAAHLKTQADEAPKVYPAPKLENQQQVKVNFHITDENLGVGGQKTKYAWNVAAIRLLNQLEKENRLATPEEQQILSRYVGWGGIPQAFDENSASWAKEYVDLKELLDADEYASARASTLNAHYTSPTVIKAIYTCLENMGFRTGNILEPACGIGNFFGLLPDSMKDSRFYGVELDSITGRIAKQLYQNASIAVQGFEETNLPDSFFDLAIGNVPFGNYSIADKRYDKYKFLIHDYFFAKTLDKVRPGGIIAFITSKGTMDKQNSEVRKYIAQRAELLGAVRLPNNAFLANAGTEVTTDIIFLQRRDRVIDIEPNWVHLAKTQDGIPINQYFADNPDMVLGTMAFDDRMYGNSTETTSLLLRKHASTWTTCNP